MVEASHGAVVRLLHKYQPSVYTGEEQQLRKTQAVFEALAIEYGAAVVVKEWGELTRERWP